MVEEREGERGNRHLRKYEKKTGQIESEISSKGLCPPQTSVLLAVSVLIQPLAEVVRERMARRARLAPQGVLPPRLSYSMVCRIGRQSAAKEKERMLQRVGMVSPEEHGW